MVPLSDGVVYYSRANRLPFPPCNFMESIIVTSHIDLGNSGMKKSTYKLWYESQHKIDPDL